MMKVRKKKKICQGKITLLKPVWNMEVMLPSFDSDQLSAQREPTSALVYSTLVVEGLIHSTNLRVRRIFEWVNDSFAPLEVVYLESAKQPCCKLVIYLKPECHPSIPRGQNAVTITKLETDLPNSHVEVETSNPLKIARVALGRRAILAPITSFVIHAFLATSS